MRSALSLMVASAAISFSMNGVVHARSLGRASGSQPAPQVKPTVDGVLNLFKLKPVVALGDYHGLQQEEALYSELVGDPRFAEQVGNVVVEFGGSAAQDVIDRYISGADVPFTELRHVWTDVVGWIPGPFALGYVNFFANVRAANLRLPAEHRIKVWLGDPKIDWTRINSFQDLQSILAQRDENIARIIVDEILKQHKKTLLIIGTGHLVRESGSAAFPAPPLVATLVGEAYPNSLAVVAPFTGYVEPECNAKVVAWAKAWPVPSVAGPITGTSLESELQLPGCTYLSPEEIEQMKRMFASIQWLGPGKPPDMMSSATETRSGVKSDALLYLGPPASLTESPWEPSIYLDLNYFKEMQRRARCCVPIPSTLSWDDIVQQNSALPRKFQPR
ncbi:MAG TPA: hypothetical protein VIX19_06760 [Terriglobales bacterium]